LILAERDDSVRTLRFDKNAGQGRCSFYYKILTSL
jgi:hypothetical protein